MENTYNGKGEHEIKARGRQKFRLKTFEPFHVEWKEAGKRVWNLVGPKSTDQRSYDVILNDKEQIKIRTEGEWTISLIDLASRGETPDGESLVEILPEGEMNMYDKLRQEMLQLFQNKAQEHNMETLEEADDLEFEDDDENLIDTPYEYKAMTEEYLAQRPEYEAYKDEFEKKEVKNDEKEEEKQEEGDTERVT